MGRKEVEGRWTGMPGAVFMGTDDVPNVLALWPATFFSPPFNPPYNIHNGQQPLVQVEGPPATLAEILFGR